MTSATNEFQGTVLWSALESIIAELETSGEIAVNTAPAYVMTYICRELVAKKVVTDAAMMLRRPGAGEP